MRNLAGVDVAEANEQVSLELKAAGVRELFEIEPDGREVRATTVGLHFKKECFFGFRRAWYYWCVKASKPFPLDKILAFNDKWGDEARIAGCAGGWSTEDVKKAHLDGYFESICGWHIDTQAALEAFITLANEVYTAQELSPTVRRICAVGSGQLVSGKIIVPEKEEVPDGPRG